MKVFVLAPNENWIVDRFVKEWNEDNTDIGTNNPQDSSMIWLMTDWCWHKIPCAVLESRSVLTTIHHIVPEKFGQNEMQDFAARDSVTSAYHVPNKHTHDFIRPLTSKPIHTIPYWCNQKIWRRTGDKMALRRKFNIPEDAFVVGSFQRDTEGTGISQGIFLPKMEKGADLFCDYVEKLWWAWNNLDLRVAGEPKKPHVVLGGWRRQYVIQRLTSAKIPFSYFELPSQEVLNELYQTLDLYPITSRYEGGPQSLLECGALGIPVVSREVGMASDVLPQNSINDDVSLAVPSVPFVDALMLPNGYQPYRKLLEHLGVMRK